MKHTLGTKTSVERKARLAALLANHPLTCQDTDAYVLSTYGQAIFEHWKAINKGTAAPLSPAPHGYAMFRREGGFIAHAPLYKMLLADIAEAKRLRPRTTEGKTHKAWLLDRLQTMPFSEL